MNEESQNSLPRHAAPGDGRNLRSKRFRFALLFGIPAAMLATLTVFILTSGRYQETDNAYIQAPRIPISANISGRITEIWVRDNQKIEAGGVLLLLDSANPKADVQQFEAAVASAKAKVESLKSEYLARITAIKETQETLQFRRSELERLRVLSEGGLAPRQDFDAAAHRVEEAKAALETARQEMATARADLVGNPDIDVSQHPLVLEAAARLERARLALSYTTIRAPRSGVVARLDQVQVGSFVNAGQTLFWLIGGNPWVDAHFKEDQLEKMRVGQAATIHLDTYPHAEFKARVASLSPGTGAVFSVLPAQNATGNWVKVVQRLTVRINFVAPPANFALRAGLSAHARVDTESIGTQDQVVETRN